MVSVKADIQLQHYTTTIVAKNNSLLADETTESGGQGKGFTPSELLASSLAACTVITCRMYADRKGWPMEAAEVNVELQTIEGVAHFSRSIKYIGPLDTAQISRLTQIANNCPIHKILSHTIQINTTVI